MSIVFLRLLLGGDPNALHDLNNALDLHNHQYLQQDPTMSSYLKEPLEPPDLKNALSNQHAQLKY